MKNYNDFQKRFDFQKFAYDINELAPEDFKSRSALFTDDQFVFLMQAMGLAGLAVLRQYDAWPNETGRPAP